MAWENRAERRRFDGGLVACGSFRRRTCSPPATFEACAQLAGELVAGTPGAQAAVHARGKAHTYSQKPGRVPACWGRRRTSAKAARGPHGTGGDVEIASKPGRHSSRPSPKAEVGGGLGESLLMADIISGEVDDQLVGKAYWVIGNVAFLCSKVAEGLQYHELAAATFSPARNLDRLGQSSTRLPRPCGSPPMLRMRIRCAASNGRNLPQMSSAAPRKITFCSN